MSEEKKICLVTNRDNGTVGYTLPDTGVHRNFAPGESKKIAVDELKALQYVPGGEYILKNLLIVGDEEILNEELQIDHEPEYFYTTEQCVDLLMNGSLDQLLDCLDFAPQGVIEILKGKAVELEIPDTRKRDAISKKTGFNITNAINVNHVMNEETNTEELGQEVKVRRSEPITTKEPARRTSAPNKYKVVETKK